AGGRAEGVAGRQQHGPILVQHPLRELAGRGGLAGAVDAGHEDHEGPGAADLERTLERGQQCQQRRLERIADFGPVFQPAALDPRTRLLQQVTRGIHADVAGEQDIFQLLEQRLVDAPCAGQQRIELCAQPRARGGQAAAQPGAPCGPGGCSRLRVVLVTLEETKHTASLSQRRPKTERPGAILILLWLIPNMIRVATGLCAALFALGSLDALSAESAPDLQQRTLSNGLQVVVKIDRRAPVAVSMLWYRVGSIDEVNGRTGLSHMLEHMMFKGTREVPAGEFSRTIARAGGRANAFTSRDQTVYHESMHKSGYPL